MCSSWVFSVWSRASDAKLGLFLHFLHFDSSWLARPDIASSIEEEKAASGLSSSRYCDEIIFPPSPSSSFFPSQLSQLAKKEERDRKKPGGNNWEREKRKLLFFSFPNFRVFPPLSSQFDPLYFPLIPSRGEGKVKKETRERNKSIRPSIYFEPVAAAVSAVVCSQRCKQSVCQNHSFALPHFFFYILPLFSSVPPFLRWRTFPKFWFASSSSASWRAQ